MMAYLTYMAERLEHMWRLLKPTGSIYLHCDPAASHYLKVVMDAIFDKKNFRNEIAWCYSTSGRSKKHFAKKRDIIFFHSGSSKYYWSDDKIPVSSKCLASHYRSKDSGGRRCRIRVDHGKERIYYPENGMICNDWWEIPYLNSMSKERLDYPTQKPLALLERIIQASSKKDHIILDPFCGCGTAVEAAHKLRRRWVGIDISSFAIDLIRNKRLQDIDVPTQGIPSDLMSARKLAREKPFDFESWAVTRIPGFAPNTKQIGDGGIDGRGMLVRKPEDFDSKLALAQVKGGKFLLSSLRDFLHTTKREQAAVGCFVTLDPVQTRDAKIEASSHGKIKVDDSQYPGMQLWSIADYFDDRMPKLPAMTDPYDGKPSSQLFLFG